MNLSGRNKTSVHSADSYHSETSEMAAKFKQVESIYNDLATKIRLLEKRRSRAKNQIACLASELNLASTEGEKYQMLQRMYQ